MRVGRSWLALAFLLLTLPLGGWLTVWVPPGHMPDEVHHAMRAWSLLHGGWLARRAPAIRPDGLPGVAALLPSEPAFVALMTLGAVPAVAEHPRMTPELDAMARAVRWSPAPVPVDLRIVAAYFPAFYLPEAAGIGLAEAVGKSPYDALLAARFANLLAYAALGAAALLLVRRGAALLFCTLALPMTLALAASASQDGVLIAATALAAALLSRAETAGPGWRWAGAALLSLVVAAKPPYLPLLALVLLPLDRGSVRRLGVAALACVPALLWAWAVAGIATPHAFAPYEAGPLWPGGRPAPFVASDVAAQLHVLLARPTRLLTVPLRTLGRDGVGYVAQMIGVLGWLNLMLPRWLYAAWLAALVAALAGGAGAAARQGLEAALLVAAWAAGVVLVLLALYLGWSQVGALVSEGPQGRYFIPLLPLLGRAMPVFWGRRLGWLVLLPLTAAALDVAVLPGLVRDWYYPG